MDKDALAREAEIATYLSELRPEQRKEAEGRINARVKLSLPDTEIKDENRAPITALGEYLDTDFPTPPFLVSSGQLVRGEITVVIGRAGKGKTTLMTNRMIRWAAGLPLFPDLEDSQVPEQPLKTLMIENEGVAWHMQRTLGGLLKAAELDTEAEKQAKENLLIWGDGGYSGLKIDKEKDLALVRKGVEETRPDVVMIEPFRGIWSGEENDATAMEAVLDDLVQIGHDYGCGIMLAHHERKSGAGEDGEDMSRARGSGDLEGKVAVMENFRQVKVQGGDYRELSWSKSRYYPTRPPIRMEFDEDTRQYHYVPESSVARTTLAIFVQEPNAWFSQDDIAEETGESKTRISKTLTELVDRGSIVKKKHEHGMRWRLKTGESGSDDTTTTERLSI